MSISSKASNVFAYVAAALVLSVGPVFAQAGPGQPAAGGAAGAGATGGSVLESATQAMNKVGGNVVDASAQADIISIVGAVFVGLIAYLIAGGMGTAGNGRGVGQLALAVLVIVVAGFGFRYGMKSFLGV
jgi:hypothetical protein